MTVYQMELEGGGCNGKEGYLEVELMEEILELELAKGEMTHVMKVDLMSRQMMLTRDKFI